MNHFHLVMQATHQCVPFSLLESMRIDYSNQPILAIHYVDSLNTERLFLYLKLEKERLLALKAAQYDTYTYYKDYQKELRTACANVDSILGQHHIRDHIQRTEQTL